MEYGRLIEKRGAFDRVQIRPWVDSDSSRVLRRSSEVQVRATEMPLLQPIKRHSNVQADS